MASLQEIKSRLNSISTTKKITKAMQLVATAKLQKAKNNLNSIQNYYSSVYEAFQDLLQNVKDVNKFVPSDGENSTLYVVITSDLGLCGGYNSGVLKMLKNSVRTQDKIVVLGNKGISSLKANSIKTHLAFPYVGDEPNYQVASNVGKEAIALFTTRAINKVVIMYTKFINSVTFEPTAMQLLPIVKSKEEEKTILGLQPLTEFEPDAETVLLNALPLYISAMIFGATVESKVSEMSSRRVAMENATDNADELIQTLDLEYNRARQASITQEITEIVAGSDTN